MVDIMAKLPRRYPVIEIFGPTIQGEGHLAGKITHFIRFGGCGFRCVWCDTMYAVEPAQVKRNSIMSSTDDMLQTLSEMTYVPWVTLSGGDPCLHYHLDNLLINIRKNNTRIAVETQGQFWRDWLLCADHITLSPKPPSSEMDTNWSELGIIVKRLHDANVDTSFKIVIFNEADLAYAALFPIRFPEIPLYLSVGTSREVKHPDAKKKSILKKWKWLSETILKKEYAVFHEARRPITIGCQQHILIDAE